MTVRTLFTYLDHASVSLPHGLLERMDGAVAADLRTRDERMRRIIPHALYSAERAERRGKAAS